MTTPPTTSAGPPAEEEQAERRFRFDFTIPSWTATGPCEAVESLMDLDVPWWEILEWRMTDRDSGERFTVTFVGDRPIVKPIIDSA